MTVNSERNLRRQITIPRDLYARLQARAREMTARGPGRVAVSDLLVEGAKKILAEGEYTP